MTRVNLIVAACSKNRGIGKNNQLPWRIPGDMKTFAKVTTTTTDPAKQNAVIMGRKTWESIPKKFKPLKNRFNVVLTSNKDLDLNTTCENVIKCSSFEEAITVLSQKDGIDLIWVIGGSSVYEAAMKSSYCHRIYLTQVETEFDCDVFFPEVPNCFKEVEEHELPTEIQTDGDVTYRYSILERLP